MAQVQQQKKEKKTNNTYKEWENINQANRD